MTYEFYKLLHLIGILLVFTTLGGQAYYMLNGGAKADAKARGLVAAGHGVGLLLLLVAGFGMLAKAGIEGFPGWVIAKLVIWVVLGGAIAVGWRKPELGKALFVGVPALGIVAVVLAVYQPF